MNIPFTKKFIKELEKCSRGYGTQEVYYRFLYYAAKSIEAWSMEEQEAKAQINDIFQNTLRMYNEQERPEMEQAYLNLFEILAEEIEREPYSDLLGPIHMELVSPGTQKGMGIFLTPESVGRMMAEMMLDKDSIKSLIAQKGFFSLEEPCLGVGCLVLSAAYVLNKSGIDVRYMYVEGTDLNEQCCLAAYVQLSLNKVACCVRRGNSLTNEIVFSMKTPALADIEYRAAAQKTKQKTAI